MNAILITLIIIMILASILIVASILLQEDKSGGGVGLLGGSSQSFFGASSSSILSKITTVLLTVFIVLALVIAIVSSSFSRQSHISGSDISRTEFESFEEELSKKGPLSVLPEKILVEDFDAGVLNRISVSTDKDFVLNFYEKSDAQYYTLKKKIADDDKEKLLGILNAVGFSLESETTIIKTEEE